MSRKKNINQTVKEPTATQTVSEPTATQTVSEPIATQTVSEPIAISNNKKGTQSIEPKQLKKDEYPKVNVVLRNTSGKEVKVEDYFFEGVILPSFEGTCGKPVEREDLLNVFNKVFKPEDNILFYKQLDKEVYLVIIPIKYSTDIGEHNNSIIGDFQKHAISFLNEGQVNLDSLRQKLEKIKKFVKYTDR